ncbi:MAG: glyoxalase superfamily protein [Planctomycetota bacterium]
MNTPTFQFGSSIPVLRMLDETLAREFYLDYLGFKIDWEHRFSDSPDSPLYMQISMGGAALHLNGHATAETPVCEVRIPVVGVVAYCEYLNKKSSQFERQDVADPRYEGKPTDLNIIDPSNNHLVFWAREEL